MNPHHMDTCQYHPCHEIPEPGTMVLCFIAAAAIVLYRWRKDLED